LIANPSIASTDGGVLLGGKGEGVRGAGSREQDIPASSPVAAVPPAAGEEDDDEELDMAAASSLMPASLDTVMVLGAGFCARLEQTGSVVCGVCGLWFVW
jgi:hypothetical protein